MTESCVLIVDDEPDMRELLTLTLARMDISVKAAEDLAEARALLAEHEFFLCLTDMRLPDGDGIELVELIQRHYFNLPVAVITAYGNVEGAVNSLKAGAFDYVSKPVDLSMLRNLVNTALKLNQQCKPKSLESHIIGESSVIQDLRETVKKLARSQAPVFISGASGVGKEVVARAIHQFGPRAEGAFVPINCGAIPSELVESEFFGHCKGSFTGAVKDKQGLFQAAEGGTLFLDEVADLSLNMQVKLLRAIQEKAVRSIGSQQEIPVDVRILSATHKNLPELVADGLFRQDLFYRINVIEVKVPNLTQRMDDLGILTEHFLQLLAERHGMPAVTLSAESVDVLSGYPFPGNIRELENILERAITLCDGQCIKADDLQLNSVVSNDDIADALPEQLDSTEKQAILTALEQTRWNKTQAAKLLGISFRSLRYRLEKWGIK